MNLLECQLVASAPGLGLAVADDRRDEQVGVVERGAVGVRERVAEFAALVDRARCLRGDVRRDAAGEGELPEQPAHTLGVRRDVGVDLRVGAVEVGVGDQAGTAVAGAGDVDGRLLALLDRPVEVRVEEVQAGRRAPVTEQAGFDVVARQRRRAAAGCPAGRSDRRTGSWRRATSRRFGRASRRSAHGDPWNASWCVTAVIAHAPAARARTQSQSNS